MRFRAILNRDGGTLRTTDLDALCARAKTIFADAGHELDCHIVRGEEVEKELKAASTDSAVDVIVAGGGDGTISAAASIAFASGKPMAVLPAGTMNLFARALAMPADLDAALMAIANGRLDKVDVATANGKVFVHQYGVGIHARLVRIRNGMVYRSRMGKMLASLKAIAAAALDPPRFEAEIIGGSNKVTKTVSGIAISNNPLDDGPIPVAARLDTGLFGVYVADSLATNELINLVFDVMTGRWRANARVSEAEVRELVLRFPKRKRGASAVIDGELIPLEPVVNFKMHQLGLAVIRPQADNLS